VKFRSLLAQTLLAVLLYGACSAIGGLQTIPNNAPTAVVLADAPGTVYAQPAALLSGTQQLQIVVELLGQFPELKQNFQRNLYRRAVADQLLVLGFRQYLRSDLYRISTFGRTDIISPFHHFF
jgi:hypothetical protein